MSILEVSAYYLSFTISNFCSWFSNSILNLLYDYVMFFSTRSIMYSHLSSLLVCSLSTLMNYVYVFLLFSSIVWHISVILWWVWTCESINNLKAYITGNGMFFQVSGAIYRSGVIRAGYIWCTWWGSWTLEWSSS